MTLQPLFPLTQQFQNKNGSNLVGGKIYIYYQGRTALATTYHDEAGTVVNPNPVLLDNNGRATVFVNTIYSYTIVVCDYYGKELFSQDITLHDAISTAKDVKVIGSDGSVKVDTTTLPNGVQYDMSVNTNIIATKESVDKVKTDLNTLTGTVNNHTTQIGQIQEDINGIDSSLANKKDKQNELNFNGSATKTVKSITQNVNGELNVEFTNIAGGSGGPINIAHDGTMTGDGTDEMPLSIQSALDVSNANTAPKYDPTATYPNIGTLCTYGNVLYRSKVAINTAEEWTEEHWEIDSVASELEEVKASPTWVDITSKLGNYDGTQTKKGQQRIMILYSRKLAMLQFGRYVVPTANGDGVKLFAFNNDIVNFTSNEFYTKSGRYVLYVSLTPFNKTTTYRKPYSITARDVTADQAIEFQFFCPLSISVDEFDAYLASH